MPHSVKLTDISFQNPAFEELDIDSIEASVQTLLETSRKKIDELTDPKNTLSNSAWIEQHEDIEYQIRKVSHLLSHLNGVCTTDALNEAYEKILPLLSAYHTDMGQNTKLYQKFLMLQQDKTLTPTQAMVVYQTLRDFKLSGIDLKPEQKKQFKELSEKLSLLGNQFDQNVLKCTQAWSLLITDKSQLEGIPENDLQRAAEKAQAKKTERSFSSNDEYKTEETTLTQETSKQPTSANAPEWLLTIDYPCYSAVVTYAKNRALRKAIFEAYTTQASDITKHHDPKWDNSQTMLDLLSAEQEMARLLGFDNYAAYALTTSMAKTPQTVFNFLDDLIKKSLPKAKEEFIELQKYAKETDGLETLEPWDMAYYSEKLSQETFNVSQEALRPYFPEEKVRSGLFTIANKLYGIQFEAVESKTWDPSVKCFKVTDENDQLRGYFYMDLYSRENKQGGAWVNEWCSRFQKEQGTDYPVVFLQANFSKPVADKPSLLTHDEVITLFHEFGHCMHCVLTTAECPSVTGFNGVPLDGVELPSQLMEYWCWVKNALELISGHYETGEPLPEEQIDNLKKSKNFQAGMAMMRQLNFSLFDMRVHTDLKIKTAEDIQKWQEAVDQQTLVTPRYADNRRQNSFLHIFGGGYDAGYYSYKWAEVLASDAFKAFESEGVLNPETGRRFLELFLSKGGSVFLTDAYKQFRGQEPSADALLEEYGIITPEKRSKMKLGF